MSLLSKIFKPLAKVASFIPGPLGALAKVAVGIGAVTGAAKVAKPILTGIPPIRSAGRGLTVLPGVGAVGKLAAPALAGAAGAFLFDQFGNPVKKKRRRMNPCNGRALSRALRRIEGYDKVRKRVDKSLRRAAPRSCRTPSRKKC